MDSVDKPRKFLSTAVVAIGLLFALDACYSLAKNSSKEDRFSIEQSDILNAVTAYRREAKTPDVALLGSSLIEIPNAEAAAVGANAPIDRLKHHRNDYLEKELASRTGIKPSVVSLAVGGEMVSDAYLIAKKLLVGSRAPRAIIYGIGPRDFQDNLMPGVDSSDTFKMLSSADDIPELWQAQQLSPESKLALTIDNISSFSGNRTQIASHANSVLDHAVSPFVSKNAKPLTPALVPTDVRKFVGGTIAPGEAPWHPDDEYMLQNYLARYNPISKTQIATQLTYFQRLLQMCKARNIPIMIANMPLGEINHKVMAPGFYENYLKDTQKICAEQGVPYIDLNVEPLNTKPYFLDTVHLNPKGSTEMFSMMSSKLDDSIAVALHRNDNSVAATSSKTF